MHRGGECERAVAVGGLAHDLEVRLAVEEGPQAAADELLVVRDEDPDHRDASTGRATLSS